MTLSRTSGAPEPLAGLAAERLDHRFKGLPPDADGRTVAELTAERRNLFTGGFPTPVLTLSAERLAHNLALLESYTTRHHLAFAPHGKTTMAPALFHRQLAHGAWGITLAMPHQVRVARKFGISRIFLANELVDAAALRWLAAEQDADPAFRHICYVDSVRGVELMDAALQEAGAVRPLEVVVELAAGPEGRTGVRTEASVVADAVSKTRTLQLVGVAGYEAQVPDATADAVRDWTRQLVALAVDFDREGRFSGPEIVVSAGGSEWFDAVTDVLAEMPELSAPVLKLLRSGAYVTHDHLHYRDRTPFNRVPEEGSLEPAFRLWAQVVSRPTAHQAFLNAGKRDVAYDLGLPVVEVIRRGSDERTADGISVTALSDQHAWLETGPGVDLKVGDWVGLGLSHPCTTFEKWPLIPVVEADGTVAEYVRTFF
ncbi:amino acid deaminase [Streptomyces acidiscabies]|uniref:amino acid deaminase n=1 Tax=Streptomyces acidiscabies TaxID=42234 RepID=UPI000E684F59|nr:amino acid deaminase [Streptomyces sp. LBUM 1476]